MKYTRIRDLREDLDLTQLSVAESINLTQRAYSYYETGERNIPVEVLSDLADFYKTSVDYLIGRTNCKKPYPNANKIKE